MLTIDKKSSDSARRSRILALAAGLFVCALGGVVLIGWWLKIEALKCVVPGLVTIKPNTAVAMLLCGAALALLSRERVGKATRSCAAAMSIVVIAVAVLILSEHHIGGDAARLHQVFWNLILNSIKFTPANGRVTVRTANPAPGQFVLTVEDTGTGIDPQRLPVIFRAFEQEDTRESQPSGGLGLGLSISKAIVELHGGTICAESAGPGLGSIFTVKLITVLPFPVARALEATESQQLQLGGRNLRLLVIEDHEPTMAVLARLLRSHGHDVLTASTVKVALLLASANSFDLVISDLGLPDGSGLDLMRQLAKEYGLRGIALSGYGMPEDRLNTQQAGFVAHLVKPINFEELRHTLQQIAPAAELGAIAEASG